MNRSKIDCNSTVSGAKQAFEMKRLVNALMACAYMLLWSHGLAETNRVKLMANIKLSGLEGRCNIGSLSNGTDLATDRAERALVLRLGSGGQVRRGGECVRVRGRWSH